MSCLFCQVGACTKVCKPPGERSGWSGRFGRLKGVRVLLVRRGLHPTGFPAGPEDKTCGDCEHLTRIVRSKTYLKCGLDRESWTHGTGTDLRVRWPACERFTEKES